jgi:phenylalanyl-tRNA synthetase beta chain
MIGIAIDQKEVVSILSRLEYRVEVKQGVYTVTVPSFRLTNEKVTPADIVEEIARSYGYNAIIPQPVSIPSRAHGNKRHMIINEIKNFSAFGMSLHELNSYAFFDETFIEKISYKPAKTLTIANPVSQNWTTLNDSLIPHLLKAVHDNSFDHAHINFFEVAPIWIFENDTWTEQLTYAALWYDQTGNHSFYDGKACVINLLNLYGITVEWKQVTDDTFWFEPYCSTTLVHQGKTVGRAGIINAQIHPHITKHLQSSLFCVEFSLDWYIQSTKKIKYSPVSCYQTVHRDLSIFINNAITFDTLKNEIILLSTLIEKIEVIEFLEKEEWKDQRAITSRITFVDHTKTLTKEIIDQAMDAIKAKVKAYGATIR